MAVHVNDYIGRLNLPGINLKPAKAKSGATNRWICWEFRCFADLHAHLTCFYTASRTKVKGAEKTKDHQKMHNFERHAKILAILQARGHATIEELAEACETSLQTTRRDLSTLTDAGSVERFHGGAKLPDTPQGTNYDADSHLGEKESAASLVLDLVPDNASVFLSGGSTMALVAKALRQREDLTIITNNIHAAVELYDRKGFELHVVGGLSRRASASIIGDRAVEFIERFKVDIAVVGTSGIDTDGTLLEYDQGIVTAMRAMLANSRQKILVADSSKFTAGGVVRGAHLSEFSTFVTDREPPASIMSVISERGVRLHHPRGAESSGQKNA